MELLLFWTFIPLSIAVVVISLIWIFRNRKGGKKFKLAGAYTGLTYLVIVYAFIFFTTAGWKERMLIVWIQFVFITLPWAGVIALICLAFIFLNLFLKKEWIKNLALFFYSGILVALIIDGTLILLVNWLR